MTPAERALLLALTNAVLALMTDRGSTGYTPLMEAIVKLNVQAELVNLEIQSDEAANGPKADRWANPDRG